MKLDPYKSSLFPVVLLFKTFFHLKNYKINLIFNWYFEFLDVSSNYKYTVRYFQRNIYSRHKHYLLSLDMKPDKQNSAVFLIRKHLI